MAGKGKRFNDYLYPKPLIEIDGKPMIEHVINHFPRDSEFIFLCSKEHLEKTFIEDTLKRLAPNSQIIGVPEEYLKGPAYTCIASFDYVQDNEEVIVNYCDFIQIWDFNEFINNVRNLKTHGAIASFRGFHPSSLGDTYYAYLKIYKDNLIEEVREKKSFSEDRTKDFASTGTYYFASGNLFKQYVSEFISNPDNSVNGEFYMSLPYNLMIRDGLKVLNHEIEKFICLGTPRDYELYRFWSEFFLKHPPTPITFHNINLNITNIFPLAGGDRYFKDLNINCLSFLLPIMNKTLLEYSLKSTPLSIRNIFVSLEENKNEFNKYTLPKGFRYNSELIHLNEKSIGNAATILAAKSYIDRDKPVCVSGCNYILDYNERLCSHLFERADIDVILFSFSHHECILRNPRDFHYAVLDGNIVKEVVGKDIISDCPYKDHALITTTIYKRAEDLFLSLEEFIKSGKEKIPTSLSALNYLIKQGKKIIIFEVDKFIPFRNIQDYLEFIYWQEYFDKTSHHPYSRILQ